jgi:mono/diheme cytochrome c family protein
MRRRHPAHSRARRTTQRPTRRLAVESLEDRCLLSGTWTPLTNLLPDPFGATHEMLLSDGTVMIQGGGAQTVSNKWYKLTPDATGSYINGTFSPRASMNVPRLFFGSNVLPSGDVFVLGGEFAPPNPPTSAAAPTDDSVGARLFQRHCAKCHHASGSGRPMRDSLSIMPDFSSRRWQASQGDAQLLASILDGKGTRMPAFRGKVTDKEARDLVARVRAFDPAAPAREADDQAADFDARFRRLQEELDDLKRQFRELSNPSRKP